MYSLPSLLLSYLRFVCPTPGWMSDAIYYEHLVNQFMRFDADKNCGYAATMWPKLLALCYPCLAQKGLTSMLVSLVLRGLRNQRSTDNPCPFDFLECFSGRGNLTYELLKAGFRGSAYDVIYEEDDHNCLTSKGLRWLLDCLACVKSKGLVWFATRCSSFVIMCRHQSERQEWNNYMGNQARPFVVCGNNLMIITSILFLVSWLLGQHPVLEQPASSVMPECPALKLVLQWTGSRKHVTYLGSFGGFSQKPLQLWSPWCGVGALIRERPIDMASSPLVRRHDENRFTGDKELLAESQCYTRAFGKAVARIVAEEWQWFDLSLLNGKDLDLSLLTIHNWWENDLWVCSYLLTDSLTAPRVFDNYGEFWMTELIYWKWQTDLWHCVKSSCHFQALSDFLN